MIDELEKLVDEIRSYEYDIMKFQQSNPLKDFVNTDPIVEGHYLTIRLGLQGIYTIGSVLTKSFKGLDC